MLSGWKSPPQYPVFKSAAHQLQGGSRSSFAVSLWPVTTCIVCSPNVWNRLFWVCENHCSSLTDVCLCAGGRGGVAPEGQSGSHGYRRGFARLPPHQQRRSRRADGSPPACHHPGVSWTGPSSASHGWDPTVCGSKPVPPPKNTHSSTLKTFLINLIIPVVILLFFLCINIIYWMKYLRFSFNCCIQIPSPKH